MTRARRFGGARGLAAAVVLLVGTMAVAWLCMLSAIVDALPPDSSYIQRVAPGDPRVVLSTATTALIEQHGLLDPAMLAAVRRAALAAPLDARAFLILGHQQLLERQPSRAVRTLEAGQRLDPRQRVIHLLLLDRYLRTARFADAATQLSLLARLIGAAQEPIARAIAAMVLQPETRAAASRTLRADPRLERAVLTALARSDTAPDTVFAIASPAARADAGGKDSWGPVLIDRLVDKGSYDAARLAWRRVYRRSAAQAAAPINNPGFVDTTPTPPFDWTLAAGSLGAAELRDGSLAVDYYGRDSGDLASQLLMLRPGRYRFAYTVDPGRTDNAARLFWSLGCARSGGAGIGTPLLDAAVRAGATRRRVAIDLTVPATCPAQRLTLRGEAGEFPAPTSVTVRDLDMRAVSGGRP